VLSWHIHYTTNTTDQPRFYYAFVDEFGSLMNPSGDITCPFGPNYGSETYPYVCSLEDAPEDAWARELAETFEAAHGAPPPPPAGAARAFPTAPIVGGSPWTTPQRAFFLPLAMIDAAWEWAQENQGYLDLLKHPNTGCMHDDHSVRALWLTAEDTAPAINVFEFPCNVPATGCNDTIYSGQPSCGCDMPVASDAPADSCENCARTY